MITSESRGQAREEEIVRSATTVLEQTMAMRDDGIPRSLLADAQAVAILPGVLKGGFVIGVQHGRGVLLVRDPNGTWRLPSFITLSGGSFGWQIGVQSTDLILIFRSRKSVDGILTGTLTLGGGASVAAGPVGRTAAAATDAQLNAEIYTYSRSRGLFAGIALDGSVMSIDQNANAIFYPAQIPGQPATAPESAIRLTQQVAALTAVAPAPMPADVVVPPSLTVPTEGTDQAAAIRTQLAQTAPQLYRQLDVEWRTFLALPAAVFEGQNPPVAALQQSLKNFETVERDPKFAALAVRPEFQSTMGLLQHYIQTLSAPVGQLQLPPPPLVGQTY
jgi:lipid-binding SYLF domain-containing protein